MTSKVYEAICQITDELSKVGIAKDRKNTQQGYAFRGIDDVYAALSPLLSKHKLCILPRVVDRQVLERATKSGGTLFYTTIQVEFDFVCAEDSSKHTVVMIGEAMDSGDKSSNKAQSAAYKYACLQTFCIPTEGDNDADATTHESLVKDSAVFESKEMRDAFVRSCITEIGKAETALEVKNQKVVNLAKWNAMKTSESPGDVEAFNKIAAEYSAAFAARSAAEKAKNTAPAATVDAALSRPSPAALLGDDEIPF